MDRILKHLNESLGTIVGKAETKEYLQNVVKYSVLFSIAIWFILVLFLDELVLSFFYALLIFFLCLGFLLYQPILTKKKIASLIEKDLPFALMSMSVGLNMKIPFEKTIENITSENYGLVSVEFRKIISDIREGGASVQEAFFSFSERTDSQMVKRCVSQLVNIYEQGAKENAGEPIRRLAAEQLAKQKAISKEFTGKLVVFSLMFIAVSAIIPALFQAFIVVGSMFMELDFTALQVLLIATVLFPLLDLGILIYIRSNTPVFLRE